MNRVIIFVLVCFYAARDCLELLGWKRPTPWAKDGRNQRESL